MPKTIHRSDWPVSGELCVVQMVKVAVQNTPKKLRGLRPRRQGGTKNHGQGRVAAAAGLPPESCACYRR